MRDIAVISFAQTPARRRVPELNEVEMLMPAIHTALSHVEMDGAWALYEAWVKLQLGELDTALVYAYAKSSPGDLPMVLTRQLDPITVAPLWADSVSLAALQARALLDSGKATEADMAG